MLLTKQAMLFKDFNSYFTSFSTNVLFAIPRLKPEYPLHLVTVSSYLMSIPSSLFYLLFFYKLSSFKDSWSGILQFLNLNLINIFCMIRLGLQGLGNDATEMNCFPITSYQEAHDIPDNTMNLYFYCMLIYSLSVSTIFSFPYFSFINESLCPVYTYREWNWTSSW